LADGLRDQLFARTVGAKNENGHVDSRNALNKCDNLPKTRIDSQEF
jgi:hypothetical protein